MRLLSLFLGLAFLFGEVHAASVKSFSPQGQIAKVRQVRAAFTEPMVTMGDPKLPAPFDINCSSAGSGVWSDDKNWVYNFERDLGPGQSCTFTLKSGRKSLAGNVIEGQTRFQFQTGGPAVLEVRPGSYGEIEPEQMFVLLPNGEATDDSVQKYAYCEVDGVHERIPVKVISGKTRDETIAAAFDKERQKERPLMKVLQCQQSLPLAKKMHVVWGKGISTPNGYKVTDPQSFEFQIRKPLRISFTCERENAESPCSPISDWTLNFSKPITRAMAKEIVVKIAGSKVKAQELDKDKNKEEELTQLVFKGPFAENAEGRIDVPSKMQAADGADLENVRDFPMVPKTALYPPLAKFATAPFGILELNADPMMPLTVRNVEASLLTRQVQPTAGPGKLAKVKIVQDSDIIHWMGKLQFFHESSITRGKKEIESRRLSLLNKQPGVENIKLPENGDANKRPFEVLGIPFKDPGFYVMEVESRALGRALLGENAPMYVRSSALVTNLSVHIKVGRENGMIWVTTLDKAAPVADAQVQVSNCEGKVLWSGKTRADGTVITPQLPGACETGAKVEHESGHISGYFVSARKLDDKGRADMAFALSSWNRGLESYRFNVPTEMSKERDVRAHTIFDRPLFRAGEKVSMKHIIRAENMQGFEWLARHKLPARVVISHLGSGQKFEFPLSWREGRAAETVFQIPPTAKLGAYQVTLKGGKKNAAKAADANSENGENSDGADNGDGDEDYGPGIYQTGTFRVEEFRLPLLEGKIVAPKGPLVAPKSLPLNLQLSYLNGGGANGMAVEVSSLLRGRSLSFAGFDDFSFQSPRASKGEEASDDKKIVADKKQITLDKNGAGKTTIEALPAITEPKEILTEMTFADPNGEVQTVSSTTALWPSNVVAGLAVSSWASVKNKLTVKAIALSTDGKPQAGVALEVVGKLRETISHRKRMVGGFYSYENQETMKDLGKLCSGKSDQHGLLRCELNIEQAGNVDLTVSAKDSDGRVSSAASSVWVTQQDEIWFEGENQDRMDVLPEKTHYKAGDTAQLQVRMPFRFATALVAIEREGVIERMVVQLQGSDPTISIPIKASYGPNVYVSVLAVRGRMREVPWYSFFTWGWKEPINWWHEFRTYQEPTALVDLAKPAYKFGMTELKIDSAGHQLAVSVTTDKTSYTIRGRAQAQIQVKLPDGRPAAGVEIALAVVDEALLELQNNQSWNVLEAMLQRRSYGIETATAQMQVVGKRHYGRKSLPPGGGGGKSPTRELLDTLLLWQPAIKLDEQGRASITIPLNDALTRFKVVAVAESGANLFGMGASSFATTQDLQIISGLPPLVREGDQFTAMVTLRNTTTRAMQVKLAAKVAGLPDGVPEQMLSIAANSASRAEWSVTVPSNGSDRGNLQWEISAQEEGGVSAVRDALKFTQRVVPAVPVTVQQATLFQLDKPGAIKMAQPLDSLPGRGGVTMNLSPHLVSNMPGIRRFFENYPYSCLEQRTSRAIGLHDDAMWQKIVSDLPGYLDSDGLAMYFPSPRAKGSDTLTAYVLAITNEAGYSLPPEARSKMVTGLTSFIQGKITREFWAPKKDLEFRKLAAIEALSRYGEARANMLESIQISPNLWPTGAVLNWYAILQRVTDVPDRAKRMTEAEQILRSRMNFQGTRMGFSAEQDDYWWWLMEHSDANALRLILVTMDQPAWRDDIPRMMIGAIGRQQRASWSSTVANAWAVVTLDKFAAKFEAEKVSGVTRASTGSNTQSHTWGSGQPAVLSLPWPSAPDSTVQYAHDGKGKPWVTLQSSAAVVLKAPFASGYRIKKTITAIEQKQPGQYSVGDVLRINIEIDAQTDMTWVVVNDPIPAGASLLGSGLGRDSELATKGEEKSGSGWPVYEERSFEAYRAYYEFVGKGKLQTSYTIRLNNAGQFSLPQTRVEAMYAPEMFGEAPNAKIVVK